MKQVINYLLTIILWGIAVVLWATGIFPYLCWFLLALHLAELLAVGWRTGKTVGVPGVKIIIMGMLFGIFWWRPLHRQIKEETFTDADFCEGV